MRRPVLILLLIALAARLLVFGSLFNHYGPGSFYLAGRGAPLSDNDSQNYVTIAKNLAEGHGYSRFAAPPFEPDGFRTPLLPIYFTPFVYFFGFSLGITLAIVFLNIILAATPVAAFYVAKLFVSKTRAFWTGAVIALEPLLVYRSQIAEPDALIVLLLLGAVYFFTLFWRLRQAKHLYLTAILLGLLTLAKPVGFYLVLIFGIFAALRHLRIKALAIYFLFFAAVIFPWVWRNHAVFGVWGVSSVTAYNFYNYYTGNLPGPEVNINDGGRDPIRNLRYSREYLGAALARIRRFPALYAKQHAVGMIRNFFASDLPGIYNNGHQDLLPFRYSPVNKENLTGFAIAGDYRQLLRTVVKADYFLLLARHAGFAIFYLVIIYAWIKSWRLNSQNFGLFTLFLFLTLYFVFTAGTFVDAKYRLPVVPLLLIMFFHFWDKQA